MFREIRVLVGRHETNQLRGGLLVASVWIICQHGDLILQQIGLCTHHPDGHAIRLRRLE